MQGNHYISLAITIKNLYTSQFGVIRKTHNEIGKIGTLLCKTDEAAKKRPST